MLSERLRQDRGLPNNHPVIVLNRVLLRLGQLPPRSYGNEAVHRDCMRELRELRDLLRSLTV